MQRDLVLLTEILDAGDRIVELVTGRGVADIEAARDVRDALLWKQDLPDMLAAVRRIVGNR